MCKFEEPGDIRAEILDLAIFAVSNVHVSVSLSIDESALTALTIIPPLDDLDASGHRAAISPQCNLREDDGMETGFWGVGYPFAMPSTTHWRTV